jgi:hypothetical protein
MGVTSPGAGASTVHFNPIYINKTGQILMAGPGSAGDYVIVVSRCVRDRKSSIPAHTPFKKWTEPSLLVPHPRINIVTGDNALA